MEFISILFTLSTVNLSLLLCSRDWDRFMDEGWSELKNEPETTLQTILILDTKCYDRGEIRGARRNW